MQPPYDHIQERGDRSWSLRLVDRLTDPDLPAGERDLLSAVLAQLEDPRTIRPLTAMVFDDTLPDAVRKSAANAVNAFGVLAEDIAIRSWWASDDAVLQHHAIYHFAAEQFDLIQQILAEPEHPFTRKAVSTMAFGFHMPEHQQAKLAALRHPDPEVRKTAARVLIWDEPIAGEAALLEATHDEDPTVIAEALATLTYYQSQRVLKRAAALRDHPDELISAQARTTFDDLRAEFCLFAEGDDYLNGWMAPVMDLLDCEAALNAEGEGDIPYEVEPTAEHPLTTARIEELLTSPDMPLDEVRALLTNPHWGAVPVGEREELARRFLAHADPIIRSGAAEILRRWGNGEALVALLDDPLAWDAAATALVDFEPRSPALGEALWVHIQAYPQYGQHAADALRAYARHTPAEDAIPHLVATATDEAQPEDLRVYAVYALARDAKTAGEVEGLLPLLEREPQVTWALHIALLEAAEAFGFVPPVEHLREVDYLYLQDALAPFV
jgi:CBS domain-containing protein